MPRLLHRLLRLCFLLTLCLAGAACGGEEVGTDDEGRLVVGNTEVEESITRGVAPGSRTLVLDGFNGNIRLRGTAGPNAELMFTKRARGDGDEAARRALQAITLEESGDDQAYRYVLRSEQARGTSVDIDGTVPEDANLQIELGNGAVVLSGIRGPLQLTVGNGDIRIGGAGARVVAETGNGDVDVGMQRLPADARVEVRAGNGDLLVTIPGTADARVDASTEVGDIAVHGLRFTSRALDEGVVGGRFTGQLGRGTAEVVLETARGSITLQEGTITTVDDDVLAGQPQEAIEDGLVGDDPRVPIPMRDSVREMTPTDTMRQPLPDLE